eukprot:SAG22_NODE_3926_length_1465_cov_3.215959_1_plen_244_part_00
MLLKAVTTAFPSVSLPFLAVPLLSQPTVALSVAAAANAAKKKVAPAPAPPAAVGKRSSRATSFKCKQPVAGDVVAVRCPPSKTESFWLATVIKIPAAGSAGGLPPPPSLAAADAALPRLRCPGSLPPPPPFCWASFGSSLSAAAHRPFVVWLAGRKSSCVVRWWERVGTAKAEVDSMYAAGELQSFGSTAEFAETVLYILQSSDYYISGQSSQVKLTPRGWNATESTAKASIAHNPDAPQLLH